MTIDSSSFIKKITLNKECFKDIFYSLLTYFNTEGYILQEKNPSEYIKVRFYFSNNYYRDIEIFIHDFEDIPNLIVKISYNRVNLFGSDKKEFLYTIMLLAKYLYKLNFITKDELGKHENEEVKTHMKNINIRIILLLIGSLFFFIPIFAAQNNAWLLYMILLLSLFIVLFIFNKFQKTRLN